MKKLSRFLFGTLLVLILAQCSKDTLGEVYENVKITFSNNPIAADSFSATEMIIDFGKELKRDQKVEVSTSHGELYAPPYTFEKAGQKSVSLVPFSKTAKLLLVASTLNPAAKVYASVTIEGYTYYDSCSFAAAYPDDFSFEVPVNIISTSANFDLPLFFKKQQHRISNGLECSVSWKHTRVGSATDSILLVVPTLVRTQNGKAAVPVRIPRYVAGDQVTVTAATRLANGSTVSRSCLLIFE